MRLPGRLETTTLGDILGALHRDGASGVLELVERGGLGGTHLLVLERGLVRHVETDAPDARLGQVLKREGFVTEVGLAHAVRRIERDPKRSIGQVLIDDRLVSEDVVRAALRHQLRERLDAVFAIDKAIVRFHVARRRQGEQTLPLSPREFLHGRPRARQRDTSVRPADMGRHTGRERPPADANRRTPREAPERGQPHASPHRSPLSRARALATLGLDAGAGAEQVRQAFRRLAASTHPDRHPTASEAERRCLMQRFAELSAAYHALA